MLRRVSRTIAAAVVLLLVAGIAVAGCGDAADEPEATGAADEPAADARPSTEAPDPDDELLPGTPEAEIGARFGIFRDFLEAGSASAACTRLSRRFVADMGGREGCERSLEAVLASRAFPSNDRRRILRFDVRGGRASITVRIRPGVTHEVPFVRDPDGWKIDGGQPWR